MSSPRDAFANDHAPTVGSLAMKGVSTESTIPSKDASCILRVLPARLLPNIRFPHYSDSGSLAYVSPVTFAQLHASKNAESHSFYCGQFRSLASPADPTPTLPPLPNADPALVRLSSSGGSGGSNVASPKSGKVWIGISDGLPAGHIVFFVLPESVDEWAFVRYAVSFT